MNALRRLFPWSWVRSLQGQILLSMAVALLIAQALSAFLIWREVHQHHVATIVNSAAMRMMGDRVLMPNPNSPQDGGPGTDPRAPQPDKFWGSPRRGLMAALTGAPWGRRCQGQGRLTIACACRARCMCGSTRHRPNRRATSTLAKSKRSCAKC